MHIFTLKPAARILAAGTALSIAFGGAALAADANAVANRIKEIYGKQGVELTFAGVKGDSSTVVLQDVKAKIAVAKAPDHKEFSVGDIQLNNVQDGADGAYKIGEVVVPDVDVQEPGKNEQGHFTVTGIRMSDVELPSPNAQGALAQMIFYHKANVAEMTFGKPGEDGMTVKDISTTLDSADRAKKIDFSMTVGSIDAAFKSKNPLEALDTDKLHATVQSSGSWAPTDGDAKLDNVTIDAQDIGKLTLSGDIGGYDVAFVEAVQKMQQDMVKNQGKQDNSAAGLAMLGLAEQLNLKNLSIRFDDASLTDKLLTYYAKKQGSDAAALREQIKMMVPLMATQLKNPDFIQSVKDASDKYFTDPKSLTLSASPDQPVTFASIAAAASLDPTKLIQLLKVGIVANN